MPTRHPPRFQTAITLAVSALAAAACMELVDHDTQRPDHGAAAILAVDIAFSEPRHDGSALPGPEPIRVSQEQADLELVGRSIANYDQ
jgi:hypothetical protein